MTTQEKIKRAEQEIESLRRRMREKRRELKRLQDLFLIEQQEKKARVNERFVSGLEEICGEITEDNVDGLLQKFRQEILN